LQFDEPVLSISQPGTDNTLFAFVCQENEAAIIDTITWLRRLAQKDPAEHSLQLSSFVSFWWREDVIVGAEMSVALRLRFDRNLSQAVKLSLKDRTTVLDFAFEKTAVEVNADQFYTNIGRLPEDVLSKADGESLQHPSITCRLFPFQRRTVAWMLEREGKTVEGSTGDAAIRGFPESDAKNDDDMPPLWEKLTDLEEQVIYINRHQGFATLDKKWVQDIFGGQKILGGILAEVSLLTSR
jgi:hypothetical protein